MYTPRVQKWALGGVLGGFVSDQKSEGDRGMENRNLALLLTAKKPFVWAAHQPGLTQDGPSWDECYAGILFSRPADLGRISQGLHPRG